MAHLPAASASSQNISLPDIPELFNENFLDVLLPHKTSVDSTPASSTATVVEVPRNAMMDALAQTTIRTRTDNNAPALSSTLSPILDAFNNVHQWATGPDITKHLNESWAQDSQLTLRIIWCLRSIPDGKSNKESFYRAYGWLLQNHPRTAIENLHLLVEPVSWKPKKKRNVSHGYWKDLLNIVAMAAMDELTPDVSNSTFLRTTKEPYQYRRNIEKEKEGTREERIAAHLATNAKRAEEAKVRKLSKRTEAHQRLTTKLNDPTFCALYIAVARLFAEALSKDMSVLREMSRVEGKARFSLSKTISLAGKWAPSPGLSHDKVTNLSSAIALLLSRSLINESLPKALDEPIGPRDKLLVLRSYYGRWVLRPLREAIQCPEPHMAAGRWDQIIYTRVPSVCMKNNTERFFLHDSKRFEEYLVKVEEGKTSISGATLMPHELVISILNDGSWVHGENRGAVGKAAKFPALQEAKKKVAEMRYRIAESQWKTLVDNLKASGSLDNALAICDVSGSMGTLAGKASRTHPNPIQVAVALSLILASLAKPPFNGGFITFSANPQYVKLDLANKSLYETIQAMQSADWGMNTDFNAVFLKLLLPLAKEHNLKQEDMVKRLFVFSDMQFDEASSEGQGYHYEKKGTAGKWETNYDLVEKAYKEAGYEVPEIVYWDLSQSAGERTVEVTGDRKGVAMMNGFSPALLKVFMGEQGEEGEEGWEKVEGEAKKTVEEEFNPVNVMKKALMRKSYNGLVVVD